MLEIAGGILLAIVILVVVLANFGWIILGLSAILTIGVPIAGVACIIMFLPPQYTGVLIVMLGAGVIAGIGYWSHTDKRFLLPDDKSSKEK
jgi:hypothetical protein